MRIQKLLIVLLIAAAFAGISTSSCSIDERAFPSSHTGGGGQTGGGGAAGSAGTAGTGASNNNAKHCTNGTKDEDETDTDCGGSCDPCDDGKVCGDTTSGKGEFCKSGNCVDGVCCKTACDGVCKACSLAKTGQPNGTCAPVTAGMDPDAECEKDGDGNQFCQKTGQCDGAGACALNGCMFKNASGNCDNGTCKLGPCNPNYGDCNQDATDGCEADLRATAHCGACDIVCAAAHGTAKCDENLKCAISSCVINFDDCNKEYNDGCETDSAADPKNCGACGKACSTANVMSGQCIGGACKILECAPGFGDCDKDASNGCEVDLSLDAAHCGACDRPCAGDHVASKSCMGKVCTSTCDLGFGNCNMPQAGNGPVSIKDDGCETDTKNAKGNCGGCGNDCGKQGGFGSDDFECDAGSAAQKLCGCSSNSECDTDGGGNAVGTCLPNGVCKCSSSQCDPGEACSYDVINFKSVCTCNLASPCKAGETCCQTPKGCFDLSTDPQSCGSCGHACSFGFVCVSGECFCDEDGDCTAGSAGTCDAVKGLCSCGGKVCSQGQRCQLDGTCG